MSEPEKKTRKSRPKSEVVKSSNVDREHKHKSKSKTDADAGERTTKRSHSRKDKSSHVQKSDNSGELEALKKEIEALKAEHDSTVNELNEKVIALKKENESLASNKKSGSSSSDESNDNIREEIANLSSQLEAERQKVASLEDNSGEVERLQRQIDDLKAENENKEKALEAEFDKYKNLQASVHSLSEKQSQLERENQELKNRSGQSFSSSNPSVMSPRGQAAQGNIPAWKQRELEKQKEAEEQRERESRAKLQKVQSLRAVRHEVISNEPITQGFKDPVLNKPTFHHGGVIEEDKKVEDSSPVLAVDQTEEEKIAAEMARMNRTLKKGGHAV